MAEYTDLTPAPDGWRWTQRPSRDRYNDWVAGHLTFTADPGLTTTRIEQLFTALRTWGEEWECLIQDYGEPDNAGAGYYLCKTVNVYPNLATPEHVRRYWPDQWCRHGHNHGPNRTSLTCTHGATPEVLVDPDGSRTRVGIVVWVPEENQYRLANRVNICQFRVAPEVLDRRLTTDRYRAQPGQTSSSAVSRARICGNGVGINFSYCTDCAPRPTCTRCAQQFQMEYGLTLPGTTDFYCNDCYAYYCDNCNNWSDAPCQHVPDNDGRFCAACRLTINADRYEQFDGEQDTLVATTLGLTNDTHRPVRTCSIELETVEGGAGLAQVLAAARLTDHSEVLGYHSSGNTRGSFCHVERDSSLGNGGGELIFDRIRLDEAGDVAKLHQAVGLVRQQIKSGLLQVSLACGLHIHVDAHGFGVGHVRNLVLVTNYLEDVLYRLSAAKYKRHRGTGHAIPLPKGPFLTKRDFGVAFFNTNEHHSALNVTPYWESVRTRCVCGAALIGEHESCTCNLGKCTFEFRHFNGTANFRKVHAYAALCQSIVAYSRLVDDLNSTDFPPQEYDGRHTGAGAVKKDKWEERLRWMLANLFFAPNERESLRYCVNHSALAELGEVRIESIFQTEYVVPDAPTQTIEHRSVRGSAAPSAPPFPSDPYRERPALRRR